MNRWLAGGFLIAFLAIGVPYLQIPYNKLDLSHKELLPGLILLGIVTVSLVGLRRATATSVLIAMLACVPAVDAVTIARDVSADPTSHNLAPLELVMLLLAGAVVVVPALLLGLLLRAVLAHTKSS